ncbi:cbb3-type cytochrome c oxidase subunit I [Alkalibacillus salilacus]|uniref:Cytochrome c oxidase subunit 1 n=1 Tax=Alkalibacillus salilacus TaxID=284582 RepID=A0ABT9VBE5_9BACI|nr:cbb3-type cytochrome c oxidase subunit I [Alkalibacillus salilacus]MDQ0158268.1 cytochrome c oxidase subunit 1 [Alkalibacillus salilacus]
MTNQQTIEGIPQTEKGHVKDRLKKFMGVQRKDATLAKAYMIVSFVSLLLGALLGLVQGLNRAGLFELPYWFNYYQVLTSHGLLLVLIFTSFFMIGYFYAGISNTLDGLSNGVRKLGWSAFWTKIAGALLAVSQVLIGEATVLYTFYPPMAASVWFYLGLTLIVLGIWQSCFGVFISAAKWRKANKGQRLPILAFFAVGGFVLLFFSSLFVAAEVLFMIIPWTLGWVETINVMVARTLFWAFGHTLVNIWYLTAVSAWYVITPKIIDGPRFSDTLTRVVVVLLVVLNIPGGFHHQIVDPGISEPIKYMHVYMSLVIGFPSLMTAYAMFYIFEKSGRKKGAKGLFGWFKKLPWKDARFLALFIAMASFIVGGAGGIAQTMHQLNQVVHNSLWVVGHFHVTLGMTAAMTFFGVSYWLIPHISGRQLTPKMNRFAWWTTIVWAIGISIMSLVMHYVGLLGAPRRTAFTEYMGNATASSWDPYLLLIAGGATIMTIGIIMQVYTVFHLMFRAPKGEEEFPIGEAEEGNAIKLPYWTERWSVWILLMWATIAMAYVVPLVEMMINGAPGSPPQRTW